LDDLGRHSGIGNVDAVETQGRFPGGDVSAFGHVGDHRPDNVQGSVDVEGGARQQSSNGAAHMPSGGQGAVRIGAKVDTA
jgi:hypothetical protein